MNILKFNPYQNIPISESLDIAEIGSIDTINKINIMFQLMKNQQGVGLAAPQIGWNKRVIVYWVDPTKTIRKTLHHIPDTIMINPIIKFKSTNMISEYEGNLSVDDLVGMVDRSNEIQVKYISINKEILTKTVSGLEARIIQHEIDQLNGIIFTKKSKKLISRSEYLKIIEQQHE